MALKKSNGEGNEPEVDNSKKSELLKITKSYEEMMGPYHTINIPRGRKDPKYLYVGVQGYAPDGRPINLRYLIQRGINVDNIPDCILKNLQNAIETSYTWEQKETNKMKDGEESHVVSIEKNHSYPYMVIETYDMKKVSKSGPKMVNNNT